MRLLSLMLLALMAFVADVRSECPALDEIPIKLGENFNCARFYYGWGHDLPVRGCNGCSVSEYADIADGQDEDAGDGFIFPMGSVMVRPGCTLYVFHGNGFGGDYDTYTGPGIWSNVRSGGDSVADGCSKGNPGIQCRCNIHAPNCHAEDGWAVTLKCDNTGAVEPTQCNYVKSIGYTFSNEVSESVSMDVTIEESIKESFWTFFSAEVSVSVSTGYDWTATSSVTKSSKEEFQVLATAPAGVVLVIEQAVGTCGGSEFRTELFRIRHTDAKGNILKTYYEKHLPDSIVTYEE